MKKATLFIFSGLPGAGKSTLASRLAKETGAAYIRVDTIEQGLAELCNSEVEAEGYRLAYRLALDNLRLGVSVIADSCNPLKLTRDEWEDVAVSSKANFHNIHIQCSDEEERRLRVNQRMIVTADTPVPDWDQVKARYYEPWEKELVSIETSGFDAEQSYLELREKLAL